MEPGMQDLKFAAQEKVSADHNVIDDAIHENADVNPTSLQQFEFLVFG
jgi:hypothetical protein